MGGFVTLWNDRAQALIIACFIAQLLVRGLLSVQLVLIAFEMFDLGSSGVGWLNAAIGIGALAGAVVTARLTGRRRLAMPFAIGLVLWGAPIVVLALAQHVLLAVAALAVIGMGNSLLDVAGFTLLQRMGDDKQLGRVFGVQFTVGVALSGLGAVLAPVLVDAVGLRTSLAITGLVLPLASLAALGRLRSIDARTEPPAETIDALLGLELLHMLPPVTIEKLAARCQVLDVEAGVTIVTEGESADCFYLIVHGSADVSKRSVHLNRLGPGDHFGEIALLAGSVRTATVRTTEPTRVLSLSGTSFVDAVTGHHETFTTAAGVIDDRLRHDGDAGVA
jgi:MFS family permease